MEGKHTYSHFAHLFGCARVMRAGVAVVVGRDILLVRQRTLVSYSGQVYPAHYGLPKGCSFRHEKTAVQTALRELREETSIHLKPQDICDNIYFVIPTSDALFIIYTAFLPVKPAVRVDMREIDGYKWVNLDSDISDISATAITFRVKHLLEFME